VLRGLQYFLYLQMRDTGRLGANPVLLLIKEGLGRVSRFRDDIDRSLS